MLSFQILLWIELESVPPSPGMGPSSYRACHSHCHLTRNVGWKQRRRARLFASSHKKTPLIELVWGCRRRCVHFIYIKTKKIFWCLVRAWRRPCSSSLNPVTMCITFFNNTLPKDRNLSCEVNHGMKDFIFMVTHHWSFYQFLSSRILILLITSQANFVRVPWGTEDGSCRVRERDLKSLIWLAVSWCHRIVYVIYGGLGGESCS